MTLVFKLTGDPPPEDSPRPPPTGEKRRQEDEHTEEEQGEAVVTRSESWWSCDIPHIQFPPRDHDQRCKGVTVRVMWSHPLENRLQKPESIFRSTSYELVVQGLYHFFDSYSYV